MLSQRPWRAEAVIQLIAGVFACIFAGMIVAVILQKSGLAAFKSQDSFANILLGTLSFQGAAWILILIFLKRHEVNWRDAFGIRNANLMKSLLLAAGVLVLALLPILYLQQLSVLVLAKLGWTPEDQRAVDLIVNTRSLWLRGYLAFFAMVLAPVAEEFIFRGVLFPFIKQLGWPKLAWFGVSFLFALIHLNAPTFVPLFALALLFTWIYDKTDCLAASITAHSLFNTANLLIMLTQNR
jgi:membrane protease YdiL (CAAX protease family)